MNEHEKSPAQGAEMPPVERAAITGSGGIDTVRGAKPADNAAQERNTNAAALDRDIAHLIDCSESGIARVPRETLVRLRTLLTSPRAASVPAGWNLLPSKLTEDMHAAAVRVIARCHGNDDWPPAVLQAFIDAAPAAPIAEPTPDPLRRRVERLLVELHAEGRLSEGQCAKMLDIHRIDWRELAEFLAPAAQAVAADGEAQDDIEGIARAAGCTNIDLIGDRAKAIERLTAFAVRVRAAVSPATAEQRKAGHGINGIPRAAFGPHTEADRIDHCCSCGEENDPQKDDVCPVCHAECSLVSTWGEFQHMRYRNGQRYANNGPQPWEDGPQPAAAEPCAHDYVRSDRVCTECGEKPATADERAAHLDLLQDVLDAKEVMLKAGCAQAAFAEMFAAYSVRASQAAAPADAALSNRVSQLEKALVYVGHRLHDTPQYMLCDGVALIDNDGITVKAQGIDVAVSLRGDPQPTKAAAPAEAREPVATFDDGLKAYLDSWTGGRHEAGSFGEVTLRFTDERYTSFREYRAKDLASADVCATFQARVQPWMLECFGPTIAADRVERNHRFLEEALETVQSLGCTASEAHQLVDYTFGRPVGEPAQEVGGVMVTLAALCLANALDMHQAGETELGRISEPAMVLKIRAKQAAKPKHSPLPQAVTTRAPYEWRDTGPLETNEGGAA